MQFSSSTLSPDELGLLIPAYEVLELTANNEQGAFYGARQISLNRMVTIKVLPQEVSQSADLQAAFTTQAKAMARLNHPNLVNVFDFGNIEDTFYMVMEYLPDRNLAELTEGHHVEHSEASQLIADICHGLAHAHQQGVIHQNLTPSSILINDDAVPKIIDFGISDLSHQDQLQESAVYIAPENEATIAADIYSVGVMLYRLLTGDFHTNFDSYTPPSEITSTDPSLDEITAIALQTDPQMRYQSASDMAADLEVYIQTHVSVATHESTTPHVFTATAPSPQQPLASATSHGSIGKTALLFILIALAAVGTILFLLKNPDVQSSLGIPKTSNESNVPATETSKEPTPKQVKE